MSDEERDKEFDYLREQSPEQKEAAADVEPYVEDEGRPKGRDQTDRDLAREQQAGL